MSPADGSAGAAAVAGEQLPLWAHRRDHVIGGVGRAGPRVRIRDLGDRGGQRAGEYVLLERLRGELRYLHYGLAAVLVFAAFKLATARWIEIPSPVSIGIIVACIAAAVWPSVRALRRLRREAATLVEVPAM